MALPALAFRSFLPIAPGLGEVQGQGALLGWDRWLLRAQASAVVLLGDWVWLPNLDWAVRGPPAGRNA
jgi:hypothetical protein